MLHQRLVCLVYVFLGDPHALIDFMRALDATSFNDDGRYLVIAVQDDTFQPDRQKKYFRKCKYRPASLQSSPITLVVRVEQSARCVCPRLSGTMSFGSF